MLRCFKSTHLRESIHAPPEGGGAAEENLDTPQRPKWYWTMRCFYVDDGSKRRVYSCHKTYDDAMDQLVDYATRKEDPGGYSSGIQEHLRYRALLSARIKLRNEWYHVVDKEKGLYECGYILYSYNKHRHVLIDDKELEDRFREYLK